jgi:hypothetical protein
VPEAFIREAAGLADRIMTIPCGVKTVWRRAISKRALVACPAVAAGDTS